MVHHALGREASHNSYWIPRPKKSSTNQEALSKEFSPAVVPGVSRSMKLNLGCGSQVVTGWVNVDYALGARLAKVPLFGPINRRLKFLNLQWDSRIYVHNLAKRLPWPDASVDVVYSSHTLEHFTRTEGYKLLNECHRVLKCNGILRIVVPDLRRVVEQYAKGNISADHFVERLGVLYNETRCSFRRALLPFVQFPHKCMYDQARLIEIFAELGFVAKIKAPFESAISDIRTIEREDRAINAVIVEGRKS